MKEFPENINPDLLIAYLSGESSTEDAALVREWIEASPENKESFEAFSRIWTESSEAFPVPADVDTDMAWQKVSQRIDRAIPAKRPSLISYSLKVAAVVVPLIIAGYLLFQQFENPKMIAINSMDKEIIQKLPDGTEITLNKNSNLQYPENFDGNTREITISGEAFLNVTPNPEQPFIIHSGDINVRVVGTSFNVFANPKSKTIEVVVKTGKVMLYTDGQNADTLYLSAGNKSVYQKEEQRFEKTEPADENDLYWINKMLVFNKTRLESVFKTLEKSYQIKIDIKNKEIADLRLTASFDQLTPERVMQIIAESFNLKISQNGSTYLIDVSEK